MYPITKSENNKIFYRLVALWAFCEGFAGGIMHLTKIPFAGMFVSSLAVLCIIFIGFFVNAKAILKATVIVAILKLMLSPHSPPTAYIAVFFQGFFGSLLLSNKKYFTGAAILLGFLALVESSIQRILVLMILYGNNFWQAINEYLSKLNGSKYTFNYSLVLAGIYVLFHAIIGIIIGIYGGRLAQRSFNWKKEPSFLINYIRETNFENFKKKKKKLKIKYILIYPLLAVLIFMILDSYINPGNSVLSTNALLLIVIRFLAIIMFYLFVIKPLIMLFIKSRLNKAQQKNKEEINKVLQILPEVKSIFTKGWQLSSTQKGLKRMKLFSKILLINILKED